MFEQLFLIPCLNGLCFAILLPLLGCYLRLRGEWLAALAYSHVAAAGALTSLAADLPLAAGGMASAGTAAISKRWLGHFVSQNVIYGLFMLLGWALAILLTANLPMAERLGHALFDGQLYFTGSEHLRIAVAALLIGLPLLKYLSRRLLLLQLFPQLASAGNSTLIFDLLAAALLALATMILGVMGAFALVFVPAWAAFVRTSRWRNALLLALVLGLGSYLLAFAVALQSDQAFGPILAIGSIICSVSVLLQRRDCTISAAMLKG